MIISPEIIVTPDYPRVILREAEEKVDLDAELPKILQTQGWEVGTPFYIQFVSHDRARLLAMSFYVVTECIEALQTSEANPQQPITRAVSTRRCAKIADLYREEKIERTAKYNPGAKCWDAYEGDERVGTGFGSKEDALASSVSEAA